MPHWAQIVGNIWRLGLMLPLSPEPSRDDLLDSRQVRQRLGSFV